MRPRLVWHYDTFDMKKQFANLLPPKEQEQLRLKQATSQVLEFGIWSLISLGVCGAILFGGSLVYGIEQQSLTDQLATQSAVLKSFEKQVLEQDVEQLNQDLKNFQILSDQHKNLAPQLVELAQLFPEDVTLDSFLWNRIDGKVKVSGRAGSRESVLSLRTNLLSSKYFRDIDFPLDNLEKANDLNWRYTFFYELPNGL